MSLPVIFISLCCLCISTPSLPAMEPVAISTSEELESLFSERVDSVIVQLRPGTYALSPTFQVESSCGNCADPDQDVFFSVGIRIRGEKVIISGPSHGSATIVTGAGYGIYFEDCRDISKIEFRRAIEPICMDLAKVEMFGDSDFCRKFCDEESSDLFRHLFSDDTGKAKE